MYGLNSVQRLLSTSTYFTSRLILYKCQSSRLKLWFSEPYCRRTKMSTLKTERCKTPDDHNLNSDLTSADVYRVISRKAVCLLRNSSPLFFDQMHISLLISHKQEQQQQRKATDFGFTVKPKSVALRCCCSCCTCSCSCCSCSLQLNRNRSPCVVVVLVVVIVHD